MRQMNEEDVRDGQHETNEVGKTERFDCHLDKEIAYAGQTSAD